MYDGQRIGDSDTPASLGMDDNDSIDVMVEREYLRNISSFLHNSVEDESLTSLQRSADGTGEPYRDLDIEKAALLLFLVGHAFTQRAAEVLFCLPCPDIGIPSLCNLILFDNPIRVYKALSNDLNQAYNRVLVIRGEGMEAVIRIVSAIHANQI